MRRINFLKSSVVRMTLIYVILFSISTSTILGWIYFFTILVKEREIKNAIEKEIKVSVRIYATQGYIGLVNWVNKRVIQLRPGDSSLYLITDQDFQPISGNLDRWPSLTFDNENWLEFKLDDNLDDSDKAFQAVARSFSTPDVFNLLIGKGLIELATYKTLMIRALFWGVLLTITLGVLGGFFLRNVLRRRLSSINQTIQKIIIGDLRKRIIRQKSGDEFDVLEKNLNSMLDQIESGMEGVRRVSDNIAHDLKTPLARLKNKAEELSLLINNDSAQTVYVDSIIKEADGLLSTFNALLRIARIEHGEQKSQFAKVELNAILHDILELYEPIAENKKQEISVDLTKNIVLWGDRDMLFQSFVNIIDNAIKYTPINGKISLKSNLDNEEWSLCIADDGVGIDASEYDKIVQRFYRTETSRTTPGSGLGLALVRAVLHLHDLSLQFKDNNPGLIVCISSQKI